MHQLCGSVAVCWVKIHRVKPLMVCECFSFFQLPAPPLLQLNPKHSPMPLNLNKSAKSLLQYRNMRARFIRQDICIIRWWPRATGAVINSRHRIKRCVPLPQGCAAGIAYSYVCTCVCVSTGSRSRSACLTSHMANEGAAPLADYDTHNTHTHTTYTPNGECHARPRMTQR